MPSQVDSAIGEPLVSFANGHVGAAFFYRPWLRSRVLFFIPVGVYINVLNSCARIYLSRFSRMIDCDKL